MKKLIVNLISTLTLAVSSSAFAATITDVGGVDSLIGSATLNNSGDNTELTWVRDLLNDQTIEMDDKYNSSGSDWELVDGESDVFATSLMQSPGYFLLKFGTGNTGVDSHFLFENIGDLNFGVVDFSDMGIDLSSNTKFHIGRISHVDEFSGTSTVPTPIPTPVPAPAGILLLGLGLVGFGMARKHKSV